MVKNINLEINFILLFLIFIAFCTGIFSSYRLGHYKPDQLEEGRVYVYRGQDNKNNILFLSEHIHLEIPTDITTNPNPSSDQDTSPIDYDELSLYRGQCFSTDIKDGDLVKKHTQDRGVVGVRKIEKEELSKS